MSKYTKIVASLGVATALGVASLPLATFAAPIPLDGSVPGSQQVVVELQVGDSVAVAVDHATANAGNASPNQTKTATTVVSYATNHNTGMTLSVNDADEDTNMTAGLGGVATAGTNVISAGTLGNVAGNGQWSIKGGLLSTQTAMVKQSENALKIQESSAPVNTDVTMTYSVSTGASQLPGTYRDTIVYTGTPK